MHHEFILFCASVARRHYSTIKNDEERLILGCICKECKFLLYASKSNTKRGWVRGPGFNTRHSCTFEEHRAISLKKKKNSTIAPLSFYAKQAKHSFCDFKHPKQSEIVDLVFKCENFKVEKSTAYSIRRKAIVELYGTDSESIQFLPALFDDFKKLDPLAFVEVPFHQEC